MRSKAEVLSTKSAAEPNLKHCEVLVDPYQMMGEREYVM